ncbi:hypothetical protein PGT21_020027 [Puccinia graminis f. sp. tritici]|uniref:Uncharacterized protein n=1 Tax=Puccinia graminis f. sp. tritici TaxID=56615 RepID=A0A5B0N147_PUCGR|nr:hypothetical protein PGT21_020027 [Puccinia graminis f. sp. tritici]KAA1124152.1 hypothetical protein PGTUg99_030345 [Puccinia graminis f. sp. tritici]
MIREVGQTGLGAPVNTNVVMEVETRNALQGSDLWIRGWFHGGRRQTSLPSQSDKNTRGLSTDTTLTAHPKNSASGLRTCCVILRAYISSAIISLGAFWSRNFFVQEHHIPIL